MPSAKSVPGKDQEKAFFGNQIACGQNSFDFSRWKSKTTMVMFAYMAGTAVETKQLAEMIQPTKLAEQGFPVPDRVSVIFGTDHTGEDAYYIVLVFPDNTPDEALAWQKIKPMVRWVQDRIWKADGEQHWPYVRVTRHSQLLGSEPNVPSQS